MLSTSAFESLSKSQKYKVNLIVDEVKWFLRNGSDLTAYQVIFPTKIQRKNVETVVAIWSKLDSKERHRLKAVGKLRELGESLAEKDAERYRWLRDVGDSHFTAFAKRMGYSATALDEHIEAAILSTKIEEKT